MLLSDALLGLLLFVLLGLLRNDLLVVLDARMRVPMVAKLAAGSCAWVGVSVRALAPGPVQQHSSQ